MDKNKLATQRAPEKVSLTEAVRIARESYQLKPPSVPIRFDGDEPATQREEASRDTQPTMQSAERDLAVEIVDGILGYTCEFAPNPRRHVSQYEWVEEKLDTLKSALGPSLPTEPEEEAVANPFDTMEWGDAESSPAALPTEAPRVEDSDG